MASKFAAEHPDMVEGLILLGAYLYGDYPPENTLTIYGSLIKAWRITSITRKTSWKSKAAIMPNSGNYGPQKGDLPATISAQDQRHRR